MGQGIFNLVTHAFNFLSSGHITLMNAEQKGLLESFKEQVVDIIYRAYDLGYKFGKNEKVEEEEEQHEEEEEESFPIEEEQEEEQEEEEEEKRKLILKNEMRIPHLKFDSEPEKRYYVVCGEEDKGVYYVYYKRYSPTGKEEKLEKGREKIKREILHKHRLTETAASFTVHFIKAVAAQQKWRISLVGKNRIIIKEDCCKAFEQTVMALAND